MNAPPQPEWLPHVTLAIAVLGAVLGVLTTWRTFNNDRVRVRVRPTTVYFPHAGQWALGVEVVNLSAFAITVDSVGFTMRGTDRHLQLMRPMLSSGDSLPKRLEPRTAFTAFAAFGTEEEEDFAFADQAYVGTACGERVTGGRRQLANVMHNLARARRR